MSRISEAVSASSDIESEIVPVPQWGIDIELRGMDGHRRSEYITRLLAAREEDNADEIARLEASLVIASAFDPEDGTRAFDENDADMLLTKSGAILGVLSQKAQRLSGLDRDAEERLGKPSLTFDNQPADVTTPATTPSELSTSDSLANST